MDPLPGGQRGQHRLDLYLARQVVARRMLAGPQDNLSSHSCSLHRVVVPEDYLQISRNTGQTPSSAHVGSADAAKPRAGTSSSSLD